ncbi:DUF7659 family protein [Staphylococcus chromogenes]|uniref:DUF7659 family protein n=1 Tax=Staphylococcus chromogenes TaxID=46126 RepID=UPI0018900195|nr:hypothetical protein [Staphylococcus chromogenes]HDF3152199.1 hypothetical protein [Staphylococcus aureus]
MIDYLDLMEEHKREIDQFPLFFAFNDEGIEEGKRKVNAKEDDKIVHVGMNGFVKKADLDAFKDMLDRHEKEHYKNMLESQEYVYHMVKYELANHEYNISYDVTDAFEACGLTDGIIRENPRIDEAVNLAIKDFKAENGM